MRYRENQPEREELDDLTSDMGIDAADLYGKPIFSGKDHSLIRSYSNYDEDSGPGGGSGITDDPALGGSTGLADDIGMHVEEGFSVGYDTLHEPGIDADTGNTMTGGYTTLEDAALGLGASNDYGTNTETALGVSDVGAPARDSLSIEAVTGGEAGYGADATDSDTDFDQQAD